MAKVHVKKDDIVVVITGDDINKRGKVLSVDREKNLVLVEGVNLHKKTRRRSQDYPQGGIDEIPLPIHASNVMRAERYDARRSAKTSAAGNDGDA